MAFILFFAFSLLLQGALGELICEELPTDLCSFSIASSGKRCLLEKCASTDGTTELQCKTSEVVVDGMSAWIETEQCIHACGVDRNSIGISSDSLLDPQFTAQLCSLACYQNCPNIIDLYFNLASAEGGFLPDLCANPHRAMSELLSSGAASGPISSSMSAISPAYSDSSADYAAAPAPFY
ncbi:hypothetical protein CK203_075145 [Vitis vinifera]|uniref:PAR1 protein n=1 Tax=Vitis vinifera TaxID=29760 RepID=A0A438F9L0_VITVI|nr:hypothetical protein CK203_075145 [Vitis vinifera]